MADVSLLGALTNRMDYLIARQSLVTSNMANANTPGYLTKDMTFEKLVASKAGGQQGMRLTNARHIQGNNFTSSGKLFTDDTNIRHDGNSVKLDEESYKLNEIQQNYALATKLYEKQKQLQQLVVRQGG